MQRYSKAIVSTFDISAIGTHVGYVTYSDRALMAFKFNALQGSGYTAKAVNGLIDGVKYMRGRNRNVHMGLDVAQGQLFTAQGGARKDARKVSI